jgi:hypothetical protein
LVSGNIVWRANIEWKKKLVLSGICCLTVAMIIVAIIRIVVGAPGKVPDQSWLLLWNSVEMTLGKCLIYLISGLVMEMTDSDRGRETAIVVSCAASFRSLYTQQRTQQEMESVALQQQFEAQTSKRRSPKSSFARDTMLGAEDSLWENTTSQHSQEALWTTHGDGHQGPQELPYYEVKVATPTVAYWPTWTTAPTR